MIGAEDRPGGNIKDPDQDEDSMVSAAVNRLVKRQDSNASSHQPMYMSDDDRTPLNNNNNNNENGSDTSSLVDEWIGGPCQVPRYCVRNPGINVCAITAVWQFLTGVERSSVVPTLILYLKVYWGKEAAEAYYGIIMAAFGMSVLIANPFFGYAASRGVRVKVLLIVSNILEIVGNLIYFQAPTPGMVFLGRFIAGLGAGCESPLYADIARSTKEAHRTPYIIAIALGKVFGLCFGPVITVIIHFMQSDYHAGGFTFTVYNAPGLIMALFWLLHTFALICYPVVTRDGKLANMRVRTRGYCRHLFLDEVAIKQDNASITAETECLDEPKTTECGKCCRWFRRHMDQLKVYQTFAIGTLILSIFCASFNSMCLEAFLPAIGTAHYNWTEMEISYTYIGVFFILIMFTGVFYFMSKRLEDRVIFLISFSVQLVAYLILLLAMCMLYDPKSDRVPIIVLSLIAIGVHAASMPGVITLPDSMFSKLVPLVDMDRAQTIARFVSNAAFMIGMYVGGQLAFIPALVSVIMLVLTIMPLALVASRYAQFKVTSFGEPDSCTIDEVNREINVS